MGSMKVDYFVVCPECFATMRRVYKPIMTTYINPADIVIDWLDYRYREKRAGKPQTSKYRCTRLSTPIPNTNWNRGKRRTRNAN